MGEGVERWGVRVKWGDADRGGKKTQRNESTRALAKYLEQNPIYIYIYIYICIYV